jgi:hypothetical protein
MTLREPTNLEAPVTAEASFVTAVPSYSGFGCSRTDNSYHICGTERLS